MVITFCGHSKYEPSKIDEEKIFAFLEKTVANKPAALYLGGYGAFDYFAYNCCKKYKIKHPNVSLVFVTPYLTVSYQKNRLDYLKANYDCILYPDLEQIPPRFAIPYRNRYMIDNADFIIAYITHDWGGAYKTYHYAQQKGKQIYNLGCFTE